MTKKTPSISKKEKKKNLLVELKKNVLNDFDILKPAMKTVATSRTRILAELRLKNFKYVGKVGKAVVWVRQYVSPYTGPSNTITYAIVILSGDLGSIGWATMEKGLYDQGGTMNFDELLLHLREVPR